jgi:hypothetical protein
VLRIHTLNPAMDGNSTNFVLGSTRAGSSFCLRKVWYFVPIKNRRAEILLLDTDVVGKSNDGVLCFGGWKPSSFRSFHLSYALTALRLAVGREQERASIPETSTGDSMILGDLVESTSATPTHIVPDLHRGISYPLFNLRQIRKYSRHKNEQYLRNSLSIIVDKTSTIRVLVFSCDWPFR